MNRDCLPRFDGQDLFIIGGGPSLRSFDFDKLKGRNVIGCNDAYHFGDDIVDINIFGDFRWWVHHKIKDAFKEFTNPVVTNNTKCKDEKRLIWFKRLSTGYYDDGVTLGWNGNTGSSAINLALVLGASRIFLLGYDMEKQGIKANWHDRQLSKPNARCYRRYIKAFHTSVQDIEKKWPDVEIINLNPDSQLTVFPKARWEDYDFDQNKEIA